MVTELSARLVERITLRVASVGDFEHELRGPELDAVARAVSVPVVGIGGMHPGNAGQVTGTAAAGCAVVGAIMTAPDPGAATRALLDLLETKPGRYERSS